MCTNSKIEKALEMCLRKNVPNWSADPTAVIFLEDVAEDMTECIYSMEPYYKKVLLGERAIDPAYKG